MGWPTDMQFALHCNDLCTLDPRFFAHSFTLFDYAMQVRILPRPREAGEIQLRDLARSYSRHMRPPINIHRLMDELPGFPSPQFSPTAHEVPRQAFAIPIDLRPSGWGVCVGLARIGASLFTFASDSLHVCAEPALHQKLARGDSIGSSKGADIDPFAPLSPAVDHVRVRRILNPFMLGATADVTAPPAVPPVEEAQMVAEHLEQDGLLRVAAHAAGCPTVHLVIDPAVSPTEFARLVSRAFAAVRPHSSLQLCWPQLHPYSQDAILHVIADLDHRRGRSDTVFLVDGRGLEVEGQGFRTFVAPSTLTAVELLAHVAACTPCRHHPAHVLVNNVLLGHTDPRTYHCPLIRLVSRQQCDRYDRQRRTMEPAALTTHSILQRMPAFRALSDTFEGFLQRAVGAFSIAGHVASTTTTTSTMPCSVRRGVTSTTTTFVANAATISHPCDPLDLAPISFHLASLLRKFVLEAISVSSYTSSAAPSGGMDVCQPVIVLRHRQGFTSQTRELTQVCREGALAWYWILAPQWHDAPRLVQCGRRGIERQELFRMARIPEQPDCTVVMRGGIWEGAIHPCHGDVVVISSPSFLVRSSPLLVLLHRVPDIQALLLRLHCPRTEIASNDPRHQLFWRSAVANCQSLLGLSHPGVRSTIAGIGIPPMVVGTGTLVLPTTAQLQAFYDGRLASRFGACTFRDTAHLDRDNALFVEVRRVSGQHLWIVRMPTGIDVRVADAAGDQLRNLHIGHGWYVQPIVRHDDFGIACVTRGTDLGRPAILRSETPVQAALAADAVEFQVPAPTGRPIPLTPNFLQFVADIRSLRNEGLITAAPQTPLAAFGGVPPPPLSAAHTVQRPHELCQIPDFDSCYPIFARMLQIVPEITVSEGVLSSTTDGADHIMAEPAAPAPEGDETTPADDEGDRAEASSLLQRQVSVFRGGSRIAAPHEKDKALFGPLPHLVVLAGRLNFLANTRLHRQVL